MLEGETVLERVRLSCSSSCAGSEQGAAGPRTIRIEEHASFSDFAEYHRSAVEPHCMTLSLSMSERAGEARLGS